MRPRIAIVAGGDSSEWVVSLRSAAGIKSFIDPACYETYGVTMVGKSWEVELADGGKATIDKNDFSFLVGGGKARCVLAYVPSQ